MSAFCGGISIAENVQRHNANLRYEQRIRYEQSQYKKLQENKLNTLEAQEDSVRTILVATVDSYIKEIAPKSKLKGSVIVDLSLKHNFDITLLLAQAHLEGQFATVGRLARTNSAFGVGAYDNGHNAYTYKDPNESIEPYILLVKSRYLDYTDNDIDKTILAVDRLLNRNYRSRSGALYAQNDIYGQRLKSIVNNINKQYDVRSLQKDLYEILVLKQEVLTDFDFQWQSSGILP